MNASTTAFVVTSISPPSDTLKKIAGIARDQSAEFILIGDRKSPANFKLDDCQYIGLSAQKKLPFQYSKICPEGHYARKNIGYLQAMRQGKSIIWETDDDNIPLADFEVSTADNLSGYLVSRPGWNNVYKYYTSENVWPRGLPLAEILQPQPDLDEEVTCLSPIQQGLANDNPDVDALYRFTGTLPIDFDKLDKPLIMEQGSWSPFNSQNTTWHKRAFPLLYLPAHCSFRMTDIWRGFIAQRILWTMDARLSFHNANVYQVRNEHDLLEDFKDEIPGYLGNGLIKDLLEGLTLQIGEEYLLENLRNCYKVMIDNNFIGIEELKLLDAWIFDIEKYHL